LGSENRKIGIRDKPQITQISQIDAGRKFSVAKALWLFLL
jgi:hypothetical protein